MTFLFDAQMPRRLAKGLEVIDQENNGLNNTHQMLHIEVLMGMGIPDETVIHEANELQAIIISQDDDFKRIRSNKELIRKYGLGYVLYKVPKHGNRYWEVVKAFLLGWEDLKARIANTPKPFILKIDKSGSITQESF